MDLTELALQKQILTSEQAASLEKWESKSKIDLWFQKGLISTEQRERLYQLTGVAKPVRPTSAPAQSKPTPKYNWFQKLALFAVACIVLGFVALIAAHWSEIPPFVKLSVYFIVSALLAGRLCFKTDKPVVREAFIWANIGWVFAGIGLIGQIFHLNGSFGTAMAFGVVLAFPFVCVSAYAERFRLWLTVLSLGLIFGSMSQYALPLILATVPLVWVYRDDLVLSGLWLFFAGMSVFFYPWPTWVFELLFDLMPTAMMWIVLSALFCGVSAICVVFCADKPLARMARTFLIGAIGVLFVWTDVRYSTDWFSAAEISTSVLAILGTVLLPVIGIWLLPEKQHKKATLACVCFCAFTLVFALLPFRLCGLIISVIALLGLAIWSARKGSVRDFNICLVLMVLRVIFAYIGVLLSLASTGLGLIGIGVLLLAGIWVYKRFYPVLLAFAQKGVIA